MPASATDQQWEIYKYINDQIRFADTKAAALLAANGVLTAALIGVLKDKDAFFRSHTFVLLLAAVGLLGLLASAGCCLMCIVPRLSTGGPRSLIFFDHIALFTGPDTYANSAETMADARQAFQEITRQVWANARVASRKHRWVARAVRWFVPGLLFATIFAIAVAW
jgi:hypothetical protein